MVKGMVVGLENTPLGPGEYQPTMRPEMTRHISTPSLGKRGIADHFHPFRSSVSRGGSSPTGQIRGGMHTPYSIDAAWSSGDSGLLYDESRSLSRESGTIFHDHDRRQPYRLNRAETPGSYIGPANIFSPVRFDGGKGQIRPVSFPKAPLDICPVRPAGETYVVKHSITEKRLVEPRIFPGERFEYNVKREPKVPRVIAEIPFAKRPVSPMRERLKDRHYTVATPASSEASRSSSRPANTKDVNGLSQNSVVSRMSSVTGTGGRRYKDPYEGKITKVKLGSRTSRYGGALIFDGSSYDKLRKPPPTNLTPATISKRAGANTFAHMLTVRQGQLPGRQPKVGSLISDKIKRFRADAVGSRDYLGN